jgi:hypothetical protein
MRGGGKSETGKVCDPTLGGGEGTTSKMSVLARSAIIYCHALFLFCGCLLDIPFGVVLGTRLLGGREAAAALPSPVKVVPALAGEGPGGGGGGSKLCRARESGRGGDGAEYGSASESARTLAGGAGVIEELAVGALRAGGGGAVRTGDDPALAGRTGGGGGALPGVVGGRFLRLGGTGGAAILRGGMEGTGRATTEGIGRTGGDGVGRAGGEVLRLTTGGGRGATGGGLGAIGGDVVCTRGGGALLGRGGALDGGAGTVRDGKPGAGRLGGAAAGAAVEGFGRGTALIGGGGAAGLGIILSRLGIVGGFPNVGAFPVIHKMNLTLIGTITDTHQGQTALQVLIWVSPPRISLRAEGLRLQLQP